MSFVPSFLIGSFAAAGLIFAAAPLIIHLLNRRRFKVVHWAAMDFLQNAIRRNRRILRLRDIILLILRTAVVLLFGLALAQPYFSSGAGDFDGQQPLHAILLFDNSRSMDFVSLEGTFLDRAKAKAIDFIKRLPEGSVISVTPVCGSKNAISPDPYASKQHAVDAIRRIECVDRPAGLQDALNAAQQAAEAAPLMSKRFVWFTDQQRVNYRNTAPPEDMASLQIVDISDERRANTWVAGLRVQDGVADITTPATIVATIRHEGPEPREDVQVTMTVDGEVAATTNVDLAPGGAREIVFEHTFASQQPTAQRPVSAVVGVSLTPDRLAHDDVRQVIVPVAASAPVVFIDQYGADEEDPLRQRFGETRSLRRLLAPGAGSPETQRQLVDVRHVRVSQVDRDLLADARLVVIAGVETPALIAATLREYVEQGGQLFIAAGAGFSAAAWNEDAWRDGQGILPMPLAIDPVGTTPEESDDLSPFSIDFESLQSHAYFQLTGNAEEDLRDLFAEPFFFKCVRPRWDEETANAWLETEVARQRARLETRIADDASVEKEESSSTGDVPTASPSRWVAWAPPPPTYAAITEANLDAEAERLALLSQPTVLASYDNGIPMLVQQRVGEGDVVFFSSGLVSPWNTVAKTNCFVIFDRILREMLRETFPARNFPAQQRVFVQLPSVEEQVDLTMERPSPDEERLAEAELLESGFLVNRSANFGALQAGVYRLQATPRTETPTGDAEPQDSKSPLWTVHVAVEQDPIESELTDVSLDDVTKLLGDAPVRVLGVHEEISLAGAQVRGQDLWWWLALAVFLLLLFELGILSSSRFATARQEVAPT